MRLQSYLNERNTYPPDQDEVHNILQRLQRDCKPFITEYKRSNCKGFLYRGSDRSQGLIQKVRSRVDNIRYPKDTPEELHNQLNNEFHKKFGWPVRNGVFTTGSSIFAKGYGRPYIFLPIGKYKYVWSESTKDLFEKFENADMLGPFVDSCLYDDADYEWYDSYDTNGKYGHWEYDGKRVHSIYIEDVVKKLGIDPVDFDIGLVKWVPDIDKNTFFQQKAEEYENKKSELISRLVDEYQNNQLDIAIKSHHEVTFNCKEYYLINPSLPEMIHDMIGEPLI